MTNYQRTAAWLQACGKVPGDNITVQAGCAIEEFTEFLEHLSGREQGTRAVINLAIEALERAGTLLKSGKAQVIITDEDRVGALDALCDVEVTINGVAYLSGFDKDAADQAVLASNDSKLEDGRPVILPGGKIGKGKDYKAPDLTAFV
jgi:predicted HAD superfamily Cof-like phosphohydrolase